MKPPKWSLLLALLPQSLSATLLSLPENPPSDGNEPPLPSSRKSKNAK